MRLYVFHVYWMLLFTSVVSSALLFLIVASESIQNSKFIGPNENQAFIQEDNLTKAENSQDKLESESETNSNIEISSSLKSKIKEENFQDTQSPLSANLDILNKNEEFKIPKEIEILKESLTQQPNLSQGISEGGPPVVLTLVDTAAGLQSLASGRNDFLSKSSSTEAVNTSTASSDEGDELQRQTTTTTTTSTTIADNLVSVSNLHDANESSINDTQDVDVEAEDAAAPDVVVVVRAEQKRAFGDRYEARSDEEREKERRTATEYGQKMPQEGEETDETIAASPQQLPKSPTTAPDLNDSAARARLTGSADDSAAAILDSLVTAGPTSDHHEEIPSFNEWAQKRLEEAEKKKTQSNVSVQTANGSPGRNVGSMRMRSKNYASPDCGAKIVAANPESRSARSVLVSTRDEYMLNTCTSRVWFVVELCEAIQAKKIELANFELFSSSPKDLSVYVSDRFPTREWSNVGQFTARDERDVQSFTLQPQLFGKFIKVELHSHYGSEHFCPISLFRAYGTSEFEVLETETESDAHSDSQRREISAEGSEAKNKDEDEEDSVFEEEVDSPSSPPAHLFGSARDAVLSIVKKAAEVLVKSEDLTATNNITKIQESISGDVLEDETLNDCVTPVYNVACHDCNDDRFARVFQLISCKGHYLESLLRAEFVRETIAKSYLCGSTSGYDYYYDSGACTDGSKAIDKKTSDTSSYYLQAQFLSSIFTPDYIIALCNVLAAREQRLFANSSHQEHKVTDGSPNKTITEQSSQLPLTTKDDKVTQTRTSETTSSDGVKAKAEAPPVIKSKLETPTETQTSESPVSQIKPIKISGSNGETRKQSSAPIPTESSKTHTLENNVNQIDISTSDLPMPTVTKKTSTISQKTSGSQDYTQTSTNIQDASTGGTASKISQNTDTSQRLNDKSSSTGSGEAEGKNEEEVDVKAKVESVEQEPKVATSDQLNFEGFDFKDIDVESLQINGAIKNDATAQQTASATTPLQKESVFLRLSNRIKALERNMSLSSQYLEELSRRYKKQVEEMQRSLERAMTVMNEESRKGEERESKRLEEVNILREQIHTLTKVLDDLIYERNKWGISFSSFLQHALFVFVDVILVILILSYCKRANDNLDFYEEEETQEKKKIIVKPGRGKTYEIVKQTCSQLSKKPKKRRPSEIASQVSGTYDQLMIEDTINQLSKKDRRKRRKKDIVLRTSSIKETSRGVVNSQDIILRESLIPTRSASANDALYLPNSNNDSLVNLQSQKQNRPESAPDASIAYFQYQQAHQQSMYDKKVQILTIDGSNDEVLQKEESANTTKELNSSFSLEDDVFEQGGSNTSDVQAKFEKLSSPIYMKTALGTRSKRISFSSSNDKKQSQSLDEEMTKPLEKKFDAKMDLLSELNINNGAGDDSNGHATNGHVDESDESRSSSTTPTGVSNKKEKKSNGLKKMVRKFF